MTIDTNLENWNKENEFSANEIKWKRIREKFASDEDTKSDDELLDEALKLCSWWSLPKYSEDFDPCAAEPEEEWSSFEWKDYGPPSFPFACQPSISVGISTLRLDSKVFTDPDWIDRDEDSQSTQDQAQSRSPFGYHKSIHDNKEHIKQHLENKIETEEVELDPFKECVYYLSMHD